MGIDNIKRLQNATTKETIAKLIKEHDIKGNLNNVKATNEDNIISLSRMGLLELNENGKRLSPKNTKKTVSVNVASAFKAKLENDPTYIASQKAKEKADDKYSEEDAGKKSTLADEIREMNAKIIADTNAYYATHGRPSTPVYTASASVNKGGQKEATNTPKKSATNASANKEPNTKKTTSKEQNTKASSSTQGTNKEKNGKKSSNEKNTKSTNAKTSKGVSDDKKSQSPAENSQAGNTQQIDGIQNVPQDSNLVNQPQPQVPDAGMQQQNGATPDLSNTYQDTGASYSSGGNVGGTSNINNSQPAQQNAKPKFYSGSIVINGANLKLEFELGQAGYGPESGRAAGKKEEESLRNQIKNKYESMQATNGKNPRQYWIEQYKKAISDEMKKPASSDREARINALNEGIKAAEAAMKAKGEVKTQNVDSMYPVANGATTDLKGRRMDKYVQNPSTADDYRHNQKVANLKYKQAYEQGEKYNKEKFKADETLGPGYGAKDEKEEAWAKEILAQKKKFDKERSYWSNEAKKWQDLAEKAEGKEAARTGKGLAR